MLDSGEIWPIFTSLGVPGLALGILYMLFRRFQWNFPRVPRNYVGPIIILYMLLISGIILFALYLFALHLWKPESGPNDIYKCPLPRKQVNIGRGGTQPGQGPFFMNELLTEQDLKGKSRRELGIMRNEIYARRGRGFKRQDLRDYFCGQPWYEPIYPPDSFPDTRLTDIQQKNAVLILRHQRNRNSSANPHSP